VSRVPHEASGLRFTVNQFRQRFQEMRGRYANSTITVSPLGIPVPLAPSDSEMSVAREVLLRTSGKRVLDAAQCCRSCTLDALDSLQDVRSTLTDQMVALARAGYQDGGLYAILELMQAGIVQFLKFTEDHSFYPMDVLGPLDRGISEAAIHEVYIPALDDLRQHLLRCLVEVSKIARMDAPNLRMLARPEWAATDYQE